jgi:hypothetical protein
MNHFISAVCLSLLNVMAETPRRSIFYGGCFIGPAQAAIHNNTSACQVCLTLFMTCLLVVQSPWMDGRGSGKEEPMPWILFRGGLRLFA